MEDTLEIQDESRQTWPKTLASLLPLWLVSISIMVEGFPQPAIPLKWAVASFVLAIFDSIILRWKRWMTVPLILVSFLPLTFLFLFDEISTTYKMPFTLMCALTLSDGIIGYQRSRSAPLGWFLLLTAAALTWVIATNAAEGFWDMAAELGYVECFPDAQGCPPLTGRETPWWALFLSF